MCTVTIIPLGNGIRMACNRDESPLRPAALPPRLATFGRRRALLPIDPVSGGTWVAANDAGLVVTLLNFYAAPHDRNAPAPKRSRGTIIPSLLDAATLAEAFERSGAILAADFADFRLVLADRKAVAEVLLDRARLVRKPPVRIDGPLLFTSSGLGEDVVGPPRRALFEGFFVARACPSPSAKRGACAGPLAWRSGSDVRENWRAQQDAFHRHSWPDRRHLSVCMRRPDARTVSYTVVEHDGDNVRMMYHADAPDQTVGVARSESELRTLNGEA
jgi:Transport and Golgi organisation 2